jgi:hypothetical protein
VRCYIAGVKNDQRWRVAMWIALAVWALLALRLMIADVWDETNGMLYFSDVSIPLGDKIHFVLTQSLGFWRPLSTLIAALFLHFIPLFDASWRVLRLVNMLMMSGALLLFLDAANRWSPRSERRRFLFTVAFLFSGSGIIAAGWYANIFDVTALLLIALGLALVSRGRELEAGVIFGIAFYAKETAVLALPFLVILLAAGRIPFRAALRAAIPALILGAIYFIIRSRIVPFGSASDVHGFDPKLFFPTLINFSSTFWMQTMKRHVGVIGLAFLALSLAALRRPRLIALTALFVIGCVVIYWGMFSEYQDGLVIAHQNFIGRLYLVPAALFLFLLLIEAQDAAIALLLIPIVFGGAETYRDHTRFQRVYRRIYRTAATSTARPLFVHFPVKPLADKVRGIDVGDHPDAKVVIDPRARQLMFR